MVEEKWNEEEYEVYADELGCIGSVVLPEEATWQQMPEELEINGFIYRLET